MDRFSNRNTSDRFVLGHLESCSDPPSLPHSPFLLTPSLPPSLPPSFTLTNSLPPSLPPSLLLTHSLPLSLILTCSHSPPPSTLSPALYNGLQWLYQRPYHCLSRSVQCVHSGQFPSSVQTEPRSANTPCVAMHTPCVAMQTPCVAMHTV